MPTGTLLANAVSNTPTWKDVEVPDPANLSPTRKSTPKTAGGANMNVSSSAAEPLTPKVLSTETTCVRTAVAVMATAGGV